MRKASLWWAAVGTVCLVAAAAKPAAGPGLGAAPGALPQVSPSPVYPPQTGPQVPVDVSGRPMQRPPDFDQKATRHRPRRQQFDAATARKQAAELAALSSKLPEEIDAVSKGVLPKELMEQLKQVQKLAKQLRSEVSQ